MNNQKFLREKSEKLAQAINSNLISKLQECGISTERNEPLFVDLVIISRILADIFNREFGVTEKTFKEINYARAKVYEQLNTDNYAKELLNLKIRKEH
jgi:ABC-type polysaccharide transport system permease subunit